MFIISGPTFGCILAKQFKNLLIGDRFFFTHKEDGNKKEKGLSLYEKTQIQSRKLSDIMCDNMDIESINRDVFQSKSKLMDCKAKTKLSLNGPTQSSSGKIKTPNTILVLESECISFFSLKLGPKKSGTYFPTDCQLLI